MLCVLCVLCCVCVCVYARDEAMVVGCALPD